MRTVVIPLAIGTSRNEFESPGQLPTYISVGMSGTMFVDYQVLGHWDIVSSYEGSFISRMVRLVGTNPYNYLLAR